MTMQYFQQIQVQIDYVNQEMPILQDNSTILIDRNVQLIFLRL